MEQAHVVFFFFASLDFLAPGLRAADARTGSIAFLVSPPSRLMTGTFHPVASWAPRFRYTVIPPLLS